MATHNPDFVKNLTKRVVKIDKGQIVSDTKHHDKHKKKKIKKRLKNNETLKNNLEKY